MSAVGQPLNAQSRGPQTERPRNRRVSEVSDTKPRGESGGVGAGVRLAIFLIILAGAGFALWKFYLLPRAPVAAVRTFIKASGSGDMEAVKSTLCRNSLAMLQMGQAMQKGAVGSFDMFQINGRPFEERKQYSLKLASLESSTAKVIIKPGPEPMDGFRAEDLPPGMQDGLSIVVVKEEKQWKVDLMATFTSMIGPAMQELMKQGPGIPGKP